jgi:hypothetical protein
MGTYTQEEDAMIRAKFMLFAAPLAVLAIAGAGPASASALQGGQRCKVANAAQYERQGFACVKANGGEHRLAVIVAEPAIRPVRHSS